MSPHKRRSEPWARAPPAPGRGQQDASGGRDLTPVWLLLGVGWRGSRKVGGRPTGGTCPTKGRHGGCPAGGSLAPRRVGVSVSPASSVSPSGAKGLGFQFCPHGDFLRPGRPPPHMQFPASEDPVWEALLRLSTWPRVSIWWPRGRLWRQCRFPLTSWTHGLPSPTSAPLSPPRGLSSWSCGSVQTQTPDFKIICVFRVLTLRGPSVSHTHSWDRLVPKRTGNCGPSWQLIHGSCNERPPTAVDRDPTCNFTR